MFLSKKYKHTQANGNDKVAGKIAKGILSFQTLFANAMHKTFRNTSVERLKISLVVFCIGLGGYSVYTIYEAIMPNSSKTGFQIDHIQTSKHITHNEAGYKTEMAFVSDKTYQQIIRFKHYMDSLKHINNKQYDSILHTRPGLMESVRMLEEIYHSQQTK